MSQQPISDLSAKRLVLEEHLPRILPASWRRERDHYYPQAGQLSAVFRSRWDLTAIVSVDVMADDRSWLHVSMSMTARLPTWNELKEVKNLFMGDVLAVQVLPRKQDYVNTHKNTLHLWHCLNGPTLVGFPGEDR